LRRPRASSQPADDLDLLGRVVAALAASVAIDSFARHRDKPGSLVTIVERPGLAFDLDTPPDLAAALAQRLSLGSP
jgi:2-phospho-L-lactate guanylyltransferase (CobY/MobA/RfbA family)